MPTPKFPTEPVPSHWTVVGFDTETWLIQPGRVAPKLVCAQFCEQGATAYVLDADEGLEKLEHFLRRPDVLLVAHNAAFDLGVFVQNHPDTETALALVWRALQERRVADTMIWARLFQIRHGWTEFDPVLNLPTTVKSFYSLEKQVLRWLGESVTGKYGEDAWRLRYQELDGTPVEQWPREAVRYAMADADYVLRLWLKMHDNEGVQADFWRKVEQSWALHLSTGWGLRTEEEAVREIEQELHKHVDAGVGKLAQAGVYKAGGTKKAPKWCKDTAEVRRRVEASCGRRGVGVPTTLPSIKFAAGQTKTDDEALKETDDEDLHLLADISGDQKLLTTYVPKLLGGVRWPLMPNYTVPVDSGRTSSWEGEFGVNIQNQPRKGGVRECFVPRKGHVYVDCDYNIAELRSLAQVLVNMYGRSAMADVVKEGDAKGSGYDVHCKMAAAIMHVDLDEYARRFKAGDKQCADMRQMAKALDFGVPGGLGPKTFVQYAKTQYGVILGEDDANAHIALYKHTFPEMEDYFTDIGAQVGYGEKTTLVQHGSQRVRGGLRFCDSCNTNFQGLTADGALAAVVRVQRECWHEKSSPLYGCRTVWFIHDQIGCEAPFDQAEAAAGRLAEVMCEEMDRFTPDVPAVAEPSMERRWYKNASTVRDAAGRLVPWVPKNPGKELLKQCTAAAGQAVGVPQVVVRHVDGPWDADDLARLKTVFPQTDWVSLDRMWRWETRARERNPDPWC